MKLRYTLLAAVAILAASCNKSAISPLEGKYPKPEKFSAGKLLANEVSKEGELRTFRLELATEGVNGSNGNYTGDGELLSLKFFGTKYFLESSTYTPSNEARKGFYLVGEGGSELIRVKSGKTEAVKLLEGGINVVNNDGDYSFSGVVWLEDGSIYKLDSQLRIVYEADPEPVLLGKVLSASSNLANGTPTVSLQLAQSNISSTLNPDWSTSWTGEGYYLALDLYSADGYLHEGSYNANSEGGKVSEGEFGIGYDTTVDFGWGPMEMKDWGTCWWYVSDGTPVATKVLSGKVTVTRKGKDWIIELISGEGKDMIWAKFEGEIEALTDNNSEVPVYYETLSQIISATSNVANGTNTVSLQIATDGVSCTQNPDWSTSWNGNGHYLAIDIFSSDGKLAAGTYKAASTPGSCSAGEFAIGWDPGDIFGIGIMFENWGSCWWAVNDGVCSAQKIVDGTVAVSLDGENYVIELQSSVVNARYSGPISL